MNLVFKKRFARDLKKREQDKSLLRPIRQVIAEVEDAGSTHEINNLKKQKAITIASDWVTIASVLS